jgi:hypothetical protein
VPDQSVWSGSSRAFLLHWNNRVGVLMLVEATPAPAGVLSLEPLDDTDWRFQFTPAVSNLTQTDPVPASLNYEQQNLHRVRIVGEIVEIEAGHPNGLFEAYFNRIRRDLLAMEISVS